MIQTELAGIMTAEKEEDEGYFDFTGSGHSLVLAKEILPTRCRYEHAWFRVTLTVTDERQGIESRLDPTISMHEFRGRADTDLGAIRFFDGDSIQGYIGFDQFSNTSMTSGTDWDPTDCYVTIHVAYDPGLTSRQTSFLNSDRSPDPDLGYITELPQLNVQVDYRGHIVGTETEQRFPKAIDHCLQFDEMVIVGLDPDSEGVDHPTFNYKEAQNLFAIESTGEVAWIAEPATSYEGDRGYYYTLWRINDSLFAKVRGLGKAGRTIVQLNPETGEIISIGH